eukprot:GHVH01003614.1.p1 GENE.GHVH01003614.1~~GHVH01003614.1.p1  ORF type:complete len:131 (-),score=23.22 GHVH01003614.1:671-1063(-)
MLNELLKRLHEENKAPNESKSNNDLKASSEDHQVPFYSEESIKRSNMNPLFPVPLNEDVMIFPEFVTEREHSNLIDLVDLIKPGILSSGTHSLPFQRLSIELAKAKCWWNCNTEWSDSIETDPQMVRGSL